MKNLSSIHNEIPIAIYEQIKVQIEQAGGKVRSRTFVMITCKPRQIRKAPLPTKFAWQSNCDHCTRMRELIKKAPLNPADQVNLTELQKHAQLARHQIEQWKKFKLNLQSHQLLIVQDFSKHYTETEKVNDFVMVFHWKNASREIRWKYLDFLSTEKQTFSFVRAVWLYLFDQTEELKNFRELLIWSDGGPQHFKIKKTTNFFSYLRQKYKSIEYHFFASNCGHSM